ncbi:MAG: hypothetical protein ACLPID_09735 [Beijerinckiaceae bacterium]
MTKKIDLKKLKDKSLNDLDASRSRLDTAIRAKFDYLLIRWMSAMTAVEFHAIWERYVEKKADCGTEP